MTNTNSNPGSRTRSISLIVPTYRRPEDMLRCMGAVEKSTRLPDEFLIVCRPDDQASRDAVTQFKASSRLPIRLVDVTVTGQIAALNAGLDASRGDIVCVTDDDAAPYPDWLQRIEQHYADDPNVVGVGGRDMVHTRDGVLNDPKTQVGIISPFGRLIGNHHLGVGGPRVVDVLKGVNMSYAGDLLRSIRFDTRLKGTGAQVHNEVAVALAIRGKNRKLIYDPAILVDHYPAERFDEDARGAQSALALSNATFNLFFSLLGRNDAKKRFMIWQWYTFVGTSTAPGFLQIGRALLNGDKDVIRRWKIVRSAALDAKRVVDRT